MGYNSKENKFQGSWTLYGQSFVAGRQLRELQTSVKTLITPYMCSGSSLNCYIWCFKFCASFQKIINFASCFVQPEYDLTKQCSASTAWWWASCRSPCWSGSTSSSSATSPPPAHPQTGKLISHSNHSRPFAWGRGKGGWNVIWPNSVWMRIFFCKQGSSLTFETCEKWNLKGARVRCELCSSR